MGRPLRFLPRPHTTFEVTCRTMQSRFLLRPSRELNELVLGVLGRALSMYPGIRLHLLVVLSNHMHLILTTPDSQTMSRFMGFVNSNIAREVGRLHDWREKFWGRRYRAIPILDDESLLARTRYVLSHGVKEGLVHRPGDWPGVQCASALLAGETLAGVWYDRTQEYLARRQGEDMPRDRFATHYPVPLSPLPCFDGLPPEEARQHTRAVVEEIVADIEAAAAATGESVLGTNGILAQPPKERPLRSRRSPAPACHTTRRERWAAFRDAYRDFVNCFRDSAWRLKGMIAPVGFPDHCFLPAAIYHTSS